MEDQGAVMEDNEMDGASFDTPHTQRADVQPADAQEVGTQARGADVGSGDSATESSQAAGAATADTMVEESDITFAEPSPGMSGASESELSELSEPGSTDPGSQASLKSTLEQPPETGNPAVDAVLREVAQLSETDPASVEPRLARAHEALHGIIDGRTDG